MNMQNDKRILVAEDSLQAWIELEAGLMKLGLKNINYVEDGQEAFDQLKAGATYDVVISDHEMPKKSGIELLVTLKDEGMLEGMGFILLTSRARDAVIHEAAFEHGAVACLMKPVQLAEMQAALIKAGVLPAPGQ